MCECMHAFTTQTHIQMLFRFGEPLNLTNKENDLRTILAPKIKH